MPSDRQANLEIDLARARRLLADAESSEDERLEHVSGLLDWATELSSSGLLEDALTCASLAAEMVEGERTEYEIDALRHVTTLAMRCGLPERARAALSALESVDRAAHEALKGEMDRHISGPDAAGDSPQRTYHHPKFGRLVEIGCEGDRVRVRGDDGVERVILRRFLTPDS